MKRKSRAVASFSVLTNGKSHEPEGREVHGTCEAPVLLDNRCDTVTSPERTSTTTAADVFFDRVATSSTMTE